MTIPQIALGICLLAVISGALERRRYMKRRRRRVLPPPAAAAERPVYRHDAYFR